MFFLLLSINTASDNLKLLHSSPVERPNEFGDTFTVTRVVLEKTEMPIFQEIQLPSANQKAENSMVYNKDASFIWHKMNKEKARKAKSSIIASYLRTGNEQFYQASLIRHLHQG